MVGHLSLSTPRWVYLYNDLPYIRSTRSTPFLALLDALEETLSAEPNVIMIDVEQQLARLTKIPICKSFACTFAIGRAGEWIARRLHQETGWLPNIIMIPLTRQELASKKYRILYNGGFQLNIASYVRNDIVPVAIIDDTIYSGQTIATVLEQLPPSVSASTQVFCLQAIAASLPRIRPCLTVHAAFEIQGRIDHDVTIVKATHLFEPDAIRHIDGDLAFYQRPEWIFSWFPKNPLRILQLCAALHRLERVQGVDVDDTSTSL